MLVNASHSDLPAPARQSVITLQNAALMAAGKSVAAGTPLAVGGLGAGTGSGVVGVSNVGGSAGGGVAPLPWFHGSARPPVPPGCVVIGGGGGGSTCVFMRSGAGPVPSTFFGE